ncbi:phosphatidylethanolamine N-methyltransferase [Rhypophila decipiens]
MSSSADLVDGVNNVRQRVQSPATPPAKKTHVANGASPPSHDQNEEMRTKRTYGKTPDGTVFVVPTTHDMVSQLLDPREPKNLSDVAVLAVLALHILAAYYLPWSLKRPVFAAVFLFWRAAYNVGIGYLLTVQSKYKLLVTWAKRWKLFEKPSSGNQPRPRLYKLLKQELEAKIPDDYKFDEAPLEYNTWLVFRRVVDLILMCDFVSYCLFAIVCGHKPDGEAFATAVARWATGIALVGFNLWVKLDAHRVVKDYAWYWGDFFYLIEQELTFDGVFEMAPHPMYSIGYAGYYGISMMAASYDVLFISILAHAAQFAFLVVVENPHIEKTYNPPPPRLRAESILSDSSSQTLEGSAADQILGSPGSKETPPAPVHNLLGIKNFDFFRTTDYSVLLLLGYLATVTLVTPSTPVYQFLFVVHALLWRLWYSVGLGIILNQQSQEKMFTRHFVKFGESPGEAWRQWKGMYHVSNAMCHASFIAACWKMYNLPEDWNYGSVLLKHVIGLGLIALQIWTATSIYESLGEFGWFYGDFFFDSTGKLTYKSIYRFLNNPERVFGTAGLWGAALITWSRAIFLMAIAGHILTIGFISYVEKPHMQKVYGRNIRDEAGLTKFIKRQLPPPVKEWQMSVDKVLDETKHFVDEFVEIARSRLAAGSSTIARDTSALFNKYPARLTLSRISADLAGYDPKHYSVSMEGTLLTGADEKATGKESASARVPKDVKTKVFEYGAPIKVRWTAPANHSKKDWVGLYMVTDNRSRDLTEVPSLGRWVPTCPGEYDTTTDQGIISSNGRVEKPSSSDTELVTGEMVFEGDKLWWTQGVFEFRYHHGGGHHVMSISEPFEVRVGKVYDEDDEVDPKVVRESEVETALLPIVRNCLDRDPEIAPNTVDEPFGGHVERDSKYARRVVYAIRHMFGIEFAPAVVPADGNVRKLAWRICNAKQVLAPYSMSQSNGSTTPITDKFPDAL